VFPTPSDSARFDPAAASREFDRLTTLAARGAVRPIALGVGLLYAGFTAAHLLVLPTDMARIMAPVAAISAVALLALAWLARGNARVRGHRGLAIIAVVTLANSLLHLSLTRDPVQTTNLYLILAGSGMLLFRSRDLAAVIAVSTTGFIAVAANDQTGNPTWTHVGIGLVSAILLSVLIHAARNRFIRRMAVLEVSARARELSLKASETRFRHLFDVSPTMICVHDMNGVVSDLNQAGAEALGADRSAIIGQSIERFLVNGPRGVHRDYLGTIHRLGRAAGLALVGTLDGRERTWLYDNMVFNDPELGQYVVGTALDVTELQEARSKLEAAKADLEEQVNARTAELRAANLRLEDELQARVRMESRLLERHKLEGLGRLAGGVAHEFNNILGIIRGNAELAAQEIQGANEYMQEIEDATVRGADLVSKVLSFSRPDPRGHAPFPLGNLVVETVEQVRRDLPAAITLELVAGDQLGEVVGSPEQIRQVLVDLVSNSRQAMDVAGGRITIRATGGCERPDLMEVGMGPYVRIEVLDTGRGISPRNLPRVFDPFFTTREVGQGYGLGLSVAHGVIRAHGGEILVESPPSGGTRVVFYLPHGPA
jgi:PAS domain S-box-containing protein